MAVQRFSDEKTSQAEPPEVESPTAFTEDEFLPSLGESEKFDIIERGYTSLRKGRHNSENRKRRHKSEKVDVIRKM